MEDSFPGQLPCPPPLKPWHGHSPCICTPVPGRAKEQPAHSPWCNCITQSFLPCVRFRILDESKSGPSALVHAHAATCSQRAVTQLVRPASPSVTLAPLPEPEAHPRLRSVRAVPASSDTHSLSHALPARAIHAMQHRQYTAPVSPPAPHLPVPFRRGPLCHTPTPHRCARATRAPSILHLSRWGQLGHTARSPVHQCLPHALCHIPVRTLPHGLLLLPPSSLRACHQGPQYPLHVLVGPGQGCGCHGTACGVVGGVWG